MVCLVSSCTQTEGLEKKSDGVVIGNYDLTRANSTDVAAQVTALLTFSFEIECSEPLNAYASEPTSSCAAECGLQPGQDTDDFDPKDCSACCETFCRNDAAHIYFEGDQKTCTSTCQIDPSFKISEDWCAIKVAKQSDFLAQSLNEDFGMNHDNPLCDSVTVGENVASSFDHVELDGDNCTAFAISRTEANTVAPQIAEHLGTDTLLVTNNHCMPTSEYCDGKAVIFGFTQDTLVRDNPHAFTYGKLNKGVSRLRVPRNQVATCQKLIDTRSVYDPNTAAATTCDAPSPLDKQDHSFFVANTSALLPGARLREHSVWEGQAIRAIGHPKGQVMQYSYGTVYQVQEGKYSFAMTADTMPGSSGTPVIDVSSSNKDAEPVAAGILWGPNFGNKNLEFGDYCFHSPETTFPEKTVFESCAERCQCVVLPEVSDNEDDARCPISDQDKLAQRERRKLQYSVRDAATVAHGCWTRVLRKAPDVLNYANSSVELRKTLAQAKWSVP